MNPSFVTVTSFSIGVLCGYLIRKNWHILNRLLRRKQTNDLKNGPSKEFVEVLETIIKPVS